jgi:hypothetical protein
MYNAYSTVLASNKYERVVFMAGLYAGRNFGEAGGVFFGEIAVKNNITNNEMGIKYRRYGMKLSHLSYEIVRNQV